MIDDPIAAPPRRRVVLALILLPAVVQAVTVAAFGSRMLLWDEFFYTPVFRAIGEGRPWALWIWHQHNEHRIVWTKLVFFAHAGFSGWNPIVDMYVSALLTALIAWGLWKLYRETGSAHPAYFVPVSLLLCSLAQYMNMLYGLMTCHYFTMAGMIWAIVFLLRRTWTGLAAAIACAAAALVSTLNAIVIAPIGLLVLVMTRQKPARWIVWSAALLGCAHVYFLGYVRPGQHPPIDWSPAALALAADAFVMNLGSPLSAGSLAWSRALGLMTVVLLAVFWSSVWSLNRRESHAGTVALSLIAVGSAAAIGLGRSALEPYVALESKYVGYSTLALVGPYLGLVCLRDLRGRREIVGGLTAVIGVGLIAANMAGFESARTWRRDRQRSAYVMQTIERQPDYGVVSIFNLPEKLPEIYDGVAYLRAARLGPFRETIDVLIAPRWREGQPTSAIAAGSPLQAHIVCPVDTLVDVGLIVSPLTTGAARGQVQVSVTARGRAIGHAQIDAREVRTTQYIRVDLDEPLLFCRGSDLVVEATSDVAAPAAAIHSWTYPVYYAGVTRQGGRPIDRQSLGVTFNAFSYGLLQ